VITTLTHFASATVDNDNHMFVVANTRRLSVLRRGSALDAAPHWPGVIDPNTGKMPGH
jgi:hypothetical protein